MHQHTHTLPVVIDSGSSSIKMGYGGNRVPQFIIPTSIASQPYYAPLDELKFFTGDEAESKSKTMNVKSPICDGEITDWSAMEQIWQHCIFKYLRADPQDHCFCLTEPHFSSPENREFTAEVMFETFNVSGLYIMVQAVAALMASWILPTKEKTLTGTVIDSGENFTHVLPIADGCVILSAVKSMPIAGKSISDFIQTVLRDREEIPDGEEAKMIKIIKEQHSYVCPSIQLEFEKYNSEPTKFIKVYDAIYPPTKKAYNFDIGYERFLGPEILFNPEIIPNSEWKTPLPVLVDEAIRSSPAQYHRALYKNIVLSGGSATFKNFHRRLQRDVARIAVTRYEKFATESGLDIVPLQVKVHDHPSIRHATWLGASLVSCTGQFSQFCHTKTDYDERGPSVCRKAKFEIST